MHFTSQCRITVFLILLVVFSLNITFWVQDTGKPWQLNYKLMSYKINAARYPPLCYGWSLEGVQVVFWTRGVFTARLYEIVSGCASIYYLVTKLLMCSSDVLTCLHGQRVVFVGDVEMQELFLFFASFLTDEPEIVKDNLVGACSCNSDVSIVWLPLTAFISEDGLSWYHYGKRCKLMMYRAPL